ncbi:hypothetical protein PENSPDRAFT_686125 [Peniophora sp. CONT]|nr:hypothetical protein PENSPDRAFT_686125 [Peniophora sp. CONT]
MLPTFSSSSAACALPGSLVSWMVVDYIYWPARLLDKPTNDKPTNDKSANDKSANGKPINILDMSEQQQGTIALNNYLQSQGRLTALSWVDIASGSQHSPTWTCTCKIDGQSFAVGTGTHKHLARNAAAEQTLRILRQA